MRTVTKTRVIDTSVIAIVLHFRTAKQTLRCARSLCAERLPRLLIVDNSDDGGASLDGIAADLDRLQEEGLKIDVLTPGRNLGFAGGVNAALAKSCNETHESILLINSDAYLERGAMAALVRCLRSADVAVPVVRRTQGAVSESLFGYYQTALALVLRRRWPGSTKYASGCCLLMRAPFTTPPLFDETFFFYGEDVELGVRLQTRGARICECLEASVVHSGSGTARNGSMFYEYHINRGHWLLAGKLAPDTWRKIVYIACRCISLPLRASVRCIRCRSTVPWRALLAATADVLVGRRGEFRPPLG